VHRELQSKSDRRRIREEARAGGFERRHGAFYTVNQLVIDVMREVGIVISRNSPKELTAEMIKRARLVVLTDTSLQKSLPGSLRRKMRKKVIEWNLPDPQGKSIEEIRYVRDRIEVMVEALAKNS